MAKSINIHKSQGITVEGGEVFSKYVVNLGTVHSVCKPRHVVRYVALSRGKQKQLFAPEESPASGMLAKIGNDPSRQKRGADNEMLKLREIKTKDILRDKMNELIAEDSTLNAALLIEQADQASERAENIDVVNSKTMYKYFCAWVVVFRWCAGSWLGWPNVAYM